MSHLATIEKAMSIEADKSKNATRWDNHIYVDTHEKADALLVETLRLIATDENRATIERIIALYDGIHKEYSEFY